MNDLNALYTDTVRQGTYVHSNPSVASGSSVTLLAANPARRYLVIQNNSAANVCVNFNNATLTGIVPSNTNPCVVLAAGASTNLPQCCTYCCYYYLSNIRRGYYQHKYYRTKLILEVNMKKEVKKVAKK